MRKYALIFSLIFAAILLGGCTALRFSQDQLPWKQNEQILYSDDFQDKTSGWEIIANADELKGYSPEGYLISVNAGSARAWETNDLVYQDIEIRTQVRLLTGAADSNFGLICRYQDAQNYYSFLISADGYYAILKTVEGKPEILGADSFTFSEAIHKGDALNDLSAVCAGSQLSLSANGQPLLSVEDDTFGRGEIGLLLETRSAGGAAAVFTFFEAARP